MSIKVLSFILTVVLLAFAAYFLVANYETCYTCNLSLASKAFPEVHNKDDVYLAIINFAFAMISVYLIAIRKFNACFIVSGIVVGLQVVAIGTILFLKA
jgi:hypothetical protein